MIGGQWPGADEINGGRGVHELGPVSWFRQATLDQLFTVELPLLHGEFHLIEPPSHQSDACLATKAERTGGEGSKSVEMSVECSLALTVERASALARLLFDFVPFSTDFDRGSGAFLEGRDAAIGPKHLFVHPDIWIQDSACRNI